MCKHSHSWHMKIMPIYYTAVLRYRRKKFMASTTSLTMVQHLECTVVDKKNATLVVIPTHIIVEK